MGTNRSALELAARCLAALWLATPGCGSPQPDSPDAAAAKETPPPAPERSAAPDPVPAAATAFVGATVFDATGRDPIPDAVVLLARDRVAAVGPAPAVALPPGAKVVDAKGKWIVPGLVDAHVHFFQSAGLYTRPDIVDLRGVRPYEAEVAAIDARLDDTFRRYLACGVTAVVDMGGPFWNFGVRDRARAALRAPRVAVAGPLVSTVAREKLELGDPPIIRAASADAARALIRKQLARKPDLTKIWFVPTPDRPYAEMLEIVRAVVDESHRGGVRVAVHATELETARAAAEAGAEILVHSVTDAPVDAAFLDLVKSKGVIYVPTLIVMDGYAEALGGEVALTALDRRYGDPRAVASWAEFDAVAGEPERQAAEARRQRVAAGTPIARANLLAVAAAGVPVAAGTDAGNIGTLPGTSLHEELVAMAAAGLGAKEVLIAATREAARVFAAEPAFGTIEPGKLADLLVLDADPLADVANLERVALVVKGGVPLAPDDILPPNPADVVDRQVDAYNARDLEAFVALYAEDAVVARHPSGEIVAEGRDGLREVYGALFAKSPALKAIVLNRVETGGWVVDQELVTGIGDRPYTHGVAIYEVEGALIERVWFLPKEKSAAK
jgi:imidazolonepropionase-like amidohydrolase